MNPLFSHEDDLSLPASRANIGRLATKINKGRKTVDIENVDKYT